MSRGPAPGARRADRQAAILARRGAALFYRCAGLIACVTLVLMMALTFVDVIGRYFFSAPIPGGYEITQIMMAVLTFAALPLVTQREEHVSITLLDSLFSPRGKRFLGIAIYTLCSLTFAFIAWRVGVLAMDSAATRETTQQAEIPLAPFRFFIAVMSGACAIVTLAALVRKLRAPGGVPQES